MLVFLPQIFRDYSGEMKSYYIRGIHLMTGTSFFVNENFVYDCNGGVMAKKLLSLVAELPDYLPKYMHVFLDMR